MQNTSIESNIHMSMDSKRLIALAREMFYASSFTESEYARLRLQKLVASLVKRGRQSLFNQAGDFLFNTDIDAYNCLLEVIESYCESCIVVEKEHRFQFLLVVIPILAWTRFTIPSGKLGCDIVQKLCKIFQTTLLAKGARVSLSPMLYAVDQLPMEPIDVYQVSQQFIESIQTGKSVVLPAKEETVQFLADGRYLLAGIMVDEGTPIFCWQAKKDPIPLDQEKEIALINWKQEVLPLFMQVLPGCYFDFLLPGGYFNTCRKTDQEVRPISVRAAVQYLEYALNIPVQALGAVIGGFGKESGGIQVEEYRIGFYSLKERKIIYGIVWPIYGTEEIDGQSIPILLEKHPTSSKIKGGKQLLAIFSLLRELGIKFDQSPVGRFMIEYCEDCGAPLFVDLNGELVHAEMPDDAKKDFKLQ